MFGVALRNNHHQYQSVISSCWRKRTNFTNGRFLQQAAVQNISEAARMEGVEEGVLDAVVTYRRLLPPLPFAASVLHTSPTFWQNASAAAKTISTTFSPHNATSATVATPHPSPLAPSWPYPRLLARRTASGDSRWRRYRHLPQTLSCRRHDAGVSRRRKHSARYRRMSPKREQISIVAHRRVFPDRWRRYSFSSAAMVGTFAWHAVARALATLLHIDHSTVRLSRTHTFPALHTRTA